MNKKKLIITISFVTVAAIIIGLAILFLFFKQNILVSSIVTLLFVIDLLVIYYLIDSIVHESNKEIEDSFNVASKQALNFGQIGILSYSDEYEITWMSNFFEIRKLDYVGEKILNWLPDLQDLLQGEVNRQVISINEDKYEICKVKNSSSLIFKDITEFYDTSKQLNDDAYVLGLVGYDNYDEYQESEDELTYVNTNIKMPVMEYFKKYNCAYKTLKNNRLMLILNEANFKKIIDDRFSILTAIRRVSSEANLDVTLSMAFAHGSNNLTLLDDSLQELLELAQTRGGDQVVVKKIGGDTTFFGGKSEAREKQNKTKVRVMINSIKDLINKSSKVIILGHKDADADCIGSGLCMSNICINIGKPVYIVCKDTSIEPMILDVVHKYDDALTSKHNLISEQEAIDLYDDRTLTIMVDHHDLSQTNAPEYLKNAKQVIIIDHHRRKADLDVIPLMYYIEASASSTCELTCEFLPYMSRKLTISPEEANIMYIGLTIDTDRFRVRTGARTFDVAKQLRRYGADPIICDELMQEPYSQVIERSNIISNSTKYNKFVLISSLTTGEYSRTIASKACDEMIKSKEIEAAFVLCNVNKEETIISARSKGKVNVQTILEKLNGGGHMMAAGLQRKDTTVEQLQGELKAALDEYFKGENKDESNTTI